ncbi:minichromosome maintenance protein [Encephalitozoon cuniculi EcunIII-L]|nr:minichromosome maintenance protein [Encephalitozoon cuniculi EcunIII-L]
MAKRRLEEDESMSEEERILDAGGVQELESEDMDEIRDDLYESEGMYEESEATEHSDIEDLISQEVKNVRPDERKGGNGDAEYDAEDILKASEVTKDFFEQDFFRAKVVRKFIRFFNEFGNKKYAKRIRQMCTENLESIEVSYLDIEEESIDLLRLLNQHAEMTIEVMDRALSDVVRMHFPNYHMIKPKVHSRVVDLPVCDSVRSLRNRHLGKLVRVSGVVTRRSGVFPLYSIVKFSCLKCRSVFGPFVASSFKPTHCFECQSKGPFTVNTSETVYKDFQKLTIQEIPGSVPPGSLPRSKEVLLFYDLIDCAKPGEEVEVTGVYKNNFNVSLNIRNGFPVFFTVIEASSVVKRAGKIEMTDDDVREIKKMGRHPEIKRIVINSIAPSVYGHAEVKRAIALAMFGGVARESTSHRIRGDINVLLLGDPGMAKSQFLRYVESTSHRAVLATGQGASSVGLTASVRKDPVVKEWTLEGGALVLADKGICLIDEFDKMNEHDRTSIHEAMEQQSISISKAGIVATLHARCSVIAAANPMRGRYNGSLTFAQNVNLSDPIISRFDILCVVKDAIDAGEDEKTAKFVIESHEGGEEKPDGFDPKRMMMGHELLRKYILYARTNVVPAFNDVDMEKISSLYLELRKESLPSGLPVTVRHVESIVRISEAFAKMRLSRVVSVEDIDEAISVVLDSFMGAQKYSMSKSLRKKFVKYFNKNNIDVLVFLLKEMFNEKMKAFRSQSVSVDEFERRISSFGFSIPSNFYSCGLFKDSGFRLDREARLILRSVY